MNKHCSSDLPVTDVYRFRKLIDRGIQRFPLNILWSDSALAVVMQHGVSPLLFAEAQNTVAKVYAHFRLRERGIMEYRSADKWLPCYHLPLSLLVHHPFAGAKEIDTIARHGL